MSMSADDADSKALKTAAEKAAPQIASLLGPHLTNHGERLLHAKALDLAANVMGTLMYGESPGHDGFFCSEHDGHRLRNFIGVVALGEWGDENPALKLPDEIVDSIELRESISRICTKELAKEGITEPRGYKAQHSATGRTERETAPRAVKPEEADLKEIAAMYAPVMKKTEDLVKDLPRIAQVAVVERELQAAVRKTLWAMLHPEVEQSKETPLLSKLLTQLFDIGEHQASELARKMEEFCLDQAVASGLPKPQEAAR